MRKILLFTLFTATLIFSEELIYQVDSSEISGLSKTITVSKPKKQKVQPIININQRNISVSVPDAPNMLIDIFLPTGRKIARKKISGDSANFPLPRSAKGVIIVTVDANRNYYSQRITVE